MKKLFMILAVIVFFRPTSAVAAQSYGEIKQEYQQAVTVYNQARDEFLLAREKLRTVRTIEQGKTVLDKAKDFLLKADLALVKYLRLERKKIEQAVVLDEGERQKALNQIDSDIVWLTNKQTEIKNASSKEELTALAGQVKNQWQKVRRDTKKITGQILAARVHFVLNKLENIGNRVGEAIARAKSAGRNTTQLENWLASYRNNLNLALEKYQAAKAKFEAISNLAEADTLFAQGMEFIQAANQALRQAHQDLKQIINALRAL